MKEKFMRKRGLFMLALAAFAAGGVFAKEGIGCDAARMPGERGAVFTALGGGIIADANRSGEDIDIDYRFWSQIFAGTWFFADTRAFELSFGLAVGRIARRNRWCFLILAANPSLFWKIPADVLGIFPLLGIGFDAVLWVQHECLRSYVVVSDAIPSGRTFRNFSSLKFKAGLGRDFNLREERFFRVRLLGYYGRRLGNPHPWGGTLRLGVGRRLTG